MKYALLLLSILLLPGPVQIHWLGSTSNNWNTGVNWSSGFVPGATDDVVIDTGVTYMPGLPSSTSGTTHNLSLLNGAYLSLGASSSLNVKGNFVNNGATTGRGILYLNGTSAQTIAGIGAVSNFNLNNTAGASITTGSRLTILNVLAIAAGTLTTNDSLVLYADSSATARVGPISAGCSISGQVKVMTYFSGGRRAFYFWSHPFSNDIGLDQVQNYIDVTGIGGTANGFTPTTYNAPSAFRYNPLVGNSLLAYDPGWLPFTSIHATADSNRLHQYQGIRLFFRGGKGQGLGSIPYTPVGLSAAQWGILNQGPQTVTLSKGSVANQEYNMVGNPYPSPTDIGTVVHNALVAGNVIGPAYFIWDPSLGASGQFMAGFVNIATPIPYYLPACNAFLVRAAYNGSTLSFAESNKGSIADNNLFGVQPGYTVLQISDANHYPYDMLYLQFTNNATAGYDSNIDAVKPFGGADLNFYTLSEDHQKLVIDARPYDTTKVIPLGLNVQTKQGYIITAKSVVLPEKGTLYLHDKLLNQFEQLHEGTEYKFTAGTKASVNDNRFELVVKSGTYR
jgi:hypothetical protein